MLYFLGFCLLLAVVLTFAAWRRPGPGRLLWRIGAGLLAVVGLWLVAFPPVRTRSLPTSSAAILLTDAYSPDSLRQLLGRLGTTTPVWRYAVPVADTPTLSNLPALRQRLPHLQTLHVLGQGLPSADMDALRGLRLVAHTDFPALGFRSAAWSRQPELGQPWAVEGYFAGRSGPTWVSLHAAGVGRDSVRLPAGRGVFRLRFTPRAEGRALYRLVARQANGVVAQEPVPLEVRPARPLRVLLLAAAPSFEIRFLKNYLASHQHAVAVRTGVSRGVVQTESLNLPTPPGLTRLTPTLLARFEVVVADAASLAGLASAETAALGQSIRAGTCGLLLLAEAAGVPRSLPAGSAFQVQALPATAAAPQPLTWPEVPARLNAPLSAVLRPAAGLLPLVTTGRQQVVAAHRRVGLGRVGVTTLTETFPWLLQGNAAAYDAYWSRLLTAVLPTTEAAATVQPLALWPRPNTPLLLRVTGAPASVLKVRPAMATTPGAVALRQDEYVPEWTTAPYWPTAPGWHEAQTGAARHWFYVFRPTDWRGPAYQQWQQTAATGRLESVVQSTNATELHRTTWPRWWGYLLFLLGAGLLWLEEKL